MNRYKIELAYNGEGFSGWQKQKNAIGIQSYIEDCISKLLSSDVEIIGCGRTDTGVHAKYFVAHFDTDVMFDNNNLVHKLNNFLNQNIIIFSITPTDNNFHARFSAKSRTYEYYISKVKDPFYYMYAWQYYRNLNIALMKEACDSLFCYTDFTSFSKLHTDVKTNNCEFFKADVSENDSTIKFTFTANRFLRNMVRALVGTIVEVGENKISVVDFKKIIESKDRSKAGQSAPAHGLFLTDLKY